MIKNLKDFKIEKGKSTCYGDMWKGYCYFKGNVIFADSCFLYYTKKEIKKILREKLLNKINKY